MGTKSLPEGPTNGCQDFFMLFLIKTYVKHVTPKAGHFWPQGYNLNKLGRGSLGDATYQILRL